MGAVEEHILKQEGVSRNLVKSAGYSIGLTNNRASNVGQHSSDYIFGIYTCLDHITDSHNLLRLAQR